MGNAATPLRRAVTHVRPFFPFLQIRVIEGTAWKAVVPIMLDHLMFQTPGRAVENEYNIDALRLSNLPGCYDRVIECYGRPIRFMGLGGLGPAAGRGQDNFRDDPMRVVPVEPAHDDDPVAAPIGHCIMRIKIANLNHLDIFAVCSQVMFVASIRSNGPVPAGFIPNRSTGGVRCRTAWNSSTASRVCAD